MKYMLDTDICIYIIKQKPANVYKRLETMKPGSLAMSAVTFAELMNGAQKSRFVKANTAKLNRLAEVLEILPFDKNAADVYGSVRSGLEKEGNSIGGNDLLIASHALSLGLVLVTNNEREFNRVHGLTIENWAKNI